MARVRCQAETCSHNSAGTCYANGIDVCGGMAEAKEETSCSSFLDKTIYSSLTNNTETGGDCDRIACSVMSCIYQNSGACTAEAIEVGGHRATAYHETACNTFRAR